jgi:hypothetical protein
MYSLLILNFKMDRPFMAPVGGRDRIVLDAGILSGISKEGCMCPSRRQKEASGF